MMLLITNVLGDIQSYPEMHAATGSGSDAHHSRCGYTHFFLKANKSNVLFTYLCGDDI